MVSCLGPRNDDSMVFICVNQRMPETVLGLVTEGYIVVSDHMLISILSMLVEPLRNVIC